MTEAGQIFALLRSSSAAELAKRFNAVEDGFALRPVPVPGGADPAPGPGQGAGGTGAGGPGVRGPGIPTPLAGVVTVAPGADAGLAEAGRNDPQGPTLTGPIRAALSMGHLAPPRSELARNLADSLLSGLVRSGGASAGASALAAAAAGMVGSGQGVVAGDQGAELMAVLSAALGGMGEADLGSSTGRPMLEGGTTGQGGEAGQGAGAGRSAEGIARHGATTATGAGAGGSGTTTEADRMGESAAPAQGQSETKGAALGPRVASGVQLAAFAEAMTAVLDAAGSGRAGTVASGVIFNAAMMPGWPFATAFAKDGAEGVNQKALLHRLATAMEGMTPQQAAEYMAKIGGGHVLLRSLRKLLKELDLIEKDEVKGLLFAFLETISTIASGIQTALRQLTESAALQAAVVHGEDPEDGDRPGRRRLKL